MSSLRIIDPGLLTTVQDLGREGWSCAGVPPSGAADTLSLRIANWICGNHSSAAAIEMSLLGATIEFNSDATIALAGAEPAIATIASPSKPPSPAALMTPIPIRAGDTLRLGPFRTGCRLYLAVAGGICVPPVMGSASTYLPGSFGGHEGRALRKGDTLSLCPTPSRAPIEIPAPARDYHRRAISSRTLRATDGTHTADFSNPELFWNSTYAVSSRSDRTGLSLEGSRIPAPHGGRMPSEGMMWGAVQVPPEGAPICLLPDHPTTGGYPVIAATISLDLPALGQLRPHDQVAFTRVTPHEARMLLREQEAFLARHLPGFA